MPDNIQTPIGSMERIDIVNNLIYQIKQELITMNLYVEQNTAKQFETTQFNHLIVNLIHLNECISVLQRY